MTSVENCIKVVETFVSINGEGCKKRLISIVIRFRDVIFIVITVIQNGLTEMILHILNGLMMKLSIL